MVDSVDMFIVLLIVGNPILWPTIYNITQEHNVNQVTIALSTTCCALIVSTLIRCVLRIKRKLLWRRIQKSYSHFLSLGELREKTSNLTTKNNDLWMVTALKWLRFWRQPWRLWKWSSTRYVDSFNMENKQDLKEILSSEAIGGARFQVVFDGGHHLFYACAHFKGF